MKKKVFSLVLAVVMCLALAAPAMAATGGKCGDNVTWSLENGVLTISGTGEMGNYSVDETPYIYPPWYSQRQSITSIVIQEGVTSIGTWAFNGSSMTTLSIPSTVTSLEEGCIGDCYSLADIQVAPGNPQLISIDGVLYTNGGKTLDSCPCAKQGAYIIPNGVTCIGGNAFLDCTRLTSVSIPDSVTTIEWNAFDGCTALTSMTIPSSVTSIGESAFEDCTSLTSIVIPNGVTSIEGWTFWGCKNLRSVTIPQSVTSIGYAAFWDCTALWDIYYTGAQWQWYGIQIDNSDNGNTRLISASIHSNSPMPEIPAQPTVEIALPTNDTLTVDGNSVTPAAYKIGGANFFKLRDVAMMLSGTPGQFSVDYDGDLQAVKIVTGQPYSPLGGELKDTPNANASASVSNNAVYINGEKVELTVYKINGQNFFGIRDLGRRLGFNVGWESGRGMFIESDKSYDESN